jgi:stage II sporulation protein D
MGQWGNDERGPQALLCITTALTIAAIAACGPVAPRGPSPSGLSLPNHVLVKTGGHVASVPLEDYVLGSALAEVSPINESVTTVARVFEIQAVLARTYAVAHLGRHRADGFDMCDTTHCQLYEPARIGSSRFAAVARQAAQRTAGRILAYAQRPADALFHADCGGSTADASAVWGGPAIPYLVQVPDDAPWIAHRSWKLLLTTGELLNALNGDRRSHIGRALDGIAVKLRDDSGRAVQVGLSGEQPHVLRGEDLRAILNQALGGRALQSTRFTIARSGGSYAFQGTGFGHGVGLCQLGAIARARRGDSLETILGTYFKGASLQRR